MKYVGNSIVYPKLSQDSMGYEIEIPVYHRAAVGIFPGTKLFMLPIPKTHDLILTPIEPKNWGDLWRIDVKLKDMPGAARSIVETLVQNKINILIQEGLSDYSHNRRMSYEMVLVVDLALYNSELDGNTHRRNTVDKPGLKPYQLINRLISNAVEYIHANSIESDWDLKMSRMDFFYRNKEHRNSAEHVHFGTGTTHFINKSVMISQSLIDKDIYEGHFPKRRACHIISDTEAKFIKIRFLKRKAKYLLLRIEHKEQIGAILEFMSVLKRNDLNIINSYSRLASMNKTANWYSFNEVPSTFSFDNLNRLIHEISLINEVEAFRIQDSFGFDDDLNIYIDNCLSQEIFKYTTQENETVTIPVQEIKYQKKKVAKKQKSSLIIPDEKNNSLGIKPFYHGKNWKVKSSYVFVAMPFNKQYEEFYDNFIRETIEGCNLRPIRIDKEAISDPNMPIMDQIKMNIATCEFVLADVTGYNQNVVYEVGLAHAIGKKVLFICEEIQKERKEGLIFDLRGYQHLFYSPYQSHTFAEKLKKNLEAIRDELD